MSDACTICGSKVDYLAVYNIVSKMSSVPVEVTGDIHSWQTLKIVQGSTITFHSMKRQQRPEFNDFSRLILGTRTFFQNVEVAPIERRKRVLDTVSRCQFSVGVVASPGFNEEEKHFDMIFEIAKSLDGLIFNGSGMVDADGLLVLDKEGNFDVA